MSRFPEVVHEIQESLTSSLWPLPRGGVPPQYNQAIENLSDVISGRLRRGDHVLHRHWGVGLFLQSHGASGDQVEVKWSDAVRTVPAHSLCRLLPRTILTRIIQSSSPDVTGWQVRKADEQGRIQPDAVGRFAGHAVHYYDPSRVPALIQQLRAEDRWSMGALVIHPQYGSGRIIGRAPDDSGRETSHCSVQFFSSGTSSVPVSELRHLIPAHVMAKRIGVNRKTFARLAARHAIHPDFVSEGRIRNFYDESRTAEIQSCWSAPPHIGPFAPGCIVMDPLGEVARLEFVDENGIAHLRAFDNAVSGTCTADPQRLRELVSIRELARREEMSRYRLQRLLAVAGIGPICRHGKTIFFDLVTATRALHGCIHREGSSINLRVLSGLTGISVEVLAKKVRQGCLKTVPRDGIHLVDEDEARRVQTLVAALNSASESIAALGVCRLQRRGRTGHEVVEWDIPALLRTARNVSPEKQSTLLDQVEWRCEAAGRRRFKEALYRYLISAKTMADHEEHRGAAELLLPLLNRLAPGFESCRIHLVLNACGFTTGHEPPERRTLTFTARTEQSGRQTCVGLEKSLSTVLMDCAHVFSAAKNQCRAPTPCSVYPEDDFIPGAVILTVAEGKQQPGVIVSVEQQSWNPVARRWDKTVVVRAENGEKRVNPHIRGSAGPVFLLLDAMQGNALFDAFRQIKLGHWSAQKAS